MYLKCESVDIYIVLKCIDALENKKVPYLGAKFLMGDGESFSLFPKKDTLISRFGLLKIY